MQAADEKIDTPASPAKPQKSEVYDFLRKHNALIVHFSGAPRGSGKERGPGHLFPNDLLHVVGGQAMGGVSCSVVRPGDVFHGLARNAIGTVGVVIGLAVDQSLVAVAPHDCGSIEDDYGNRIVEVEVDISTEDLERSLLERPEGDYNEWVVRNFQVLGIFIAPPCEVSVLRIPDYPDDMPSELRDGEPIPDIEKISVADVVSYFKELPVYCFSGGDIFFLDRNNWKKVDHSSIYGDAP